MRMHIRWGLLLLAGAGFSIVAAGEAQAFPIYGGGCSASFCHGPSEGTTRSGAMELTNTLGDLTVGSVTRQYYEVQRGQTAHLTFSVLDGSDFYAVALNGLDNPGVINGTVLDYSPDGSWTDRGTYFTLDTGDRSGFDWGSVAVPLQFDLAVSATSPLDTYELAFTTAGLNGGKWSDEERFYLRVTEAVPEPASWVLFSCLGVGLVWYGRRRKR